MQLISIPQTGGTLYKDTQHIIRIQACSNYSKIYCSNEKYPITVAKILQWFQDNLPTENFIRTHRTHLINKKFINKKEGNYMLLHNGESIGISRRRKSQLSKIA